MDLAFFSLLVDGELDHALLGVLTLDFADDSEELWVHADGLFVSLDPAHSRVS